MFFGKLIAGGLGFLMTQSFVGLIIGVIVGHLFDRGLGQAFAVGSPANVARIKQSFFETTFLLLGHLAKVDGRISQQEINHTETIIAQMGLVAEQRLKAIELFRRGAEPDFQLEATLSSFLKVCDRQHQLQQTLLLFLVSLALADDHLDNQERDALLRIGQLLGFNRNQVTSFLRMAQAQSRFHQSGGGGQQSAANSGQSLDDAYAALGVASTATDAEIKRAFRKLMSENHPDKLIAKGVPEDMVKVATEKSQDISTAYDMIRKSRGS